MAEIQVLRMRLLGLPVTNKSNFAMTFDGGFPVCHKPSLSVQFNARQKHSFRTSPGL